jgi:hypothetical protein
MEIWPAVDARPWDGGVPGQSSAGRYDGNVRQRDGVWLALDPVVSDAPLAPCRLCHQGRPDVKAVESGPLS